MEFAVRGRTVATAATADHCVAELWNPHSTQRIRVREIALNCIAAAPAAGASVYLRRSTARGTAGSTVTPGIQHDADRAIAPPSGALLDLAAFTGQPTFETGGFWGWGFAAVQASGVIYPFGNWAPKGLVIPPAAGLCIVTAAAVAIPASEVMFAVEE